MWCTYEYMQHVYPGTCDHRSGNPLFALRCPFFEAKGTLSFASSFFTTVLWKCWCMYMYWSIRSSTALVCIVDLTSIVDLICVCWNVTYAEELLP